MGENKHNLMVTDKEESLIMLIRRQDIKNGSIPCIIYIQDGKLFSVKLEKYFERVKL